MHVTIGNDDNRQQLWMPAPDLKVEKGGRHTGVVALPSAEIALLDSETGTLGGEQLKWLREQLVDSERHDLPMLGFVHYNPYPRPGVRPLKGLNSKESDSLLALVTEQTRAKALFFGHTHDWAVEQWIDVHMPLRDRRGARKACCSSPYGYWLHRDRTLRDRKRRQATRAALPRRYRGKYPVSSWTRFP